MRGIWLVPVLVALVLAHAALDGDAGLRHWLHLRAELADARSRIAGLEREVERLRAEAAGLEADDFAVERAIREELWLARPGQTVLRPAGTGVSSVRIP